MADRAVFRNNLAVVADVLSIMAAKASWCVKVTDVVGVRPPVHFHVGKDGGLVDVPKIGNGSVNG